MEKREQLAFHFEIIVARRDKHSNATHVAIFDAGIRRSRTLSRDGVEVISAKKVVAEPLDAAN